MFRLLCLYSAVNNGIKESMFRTVKTEVVNAYGIEFLFHLENLETAGLLKVHKSTTFFVLSCRFNCA